MLKKKAVRKFEDKEEKKAHRIPLKKYTQGGRTASFIALCNLVVILATIGISILKKGNAGIYVGFMMLAVLVSAAAGFVIGINSFKEENKFLRFTYIGTIANAVIWIGILGIYLIFV
ncbi:MAG: hypothetical protein ACLRZ9_07870 [Eubacterium sp.]